MMINGDKKEEKKHLSFSEVSVFSQCPYKWHLEYRQGLRSPNNIYNIFGNAVHDAIDRRKETGCENSWVTMGKTIVKWIRENPDPDPWSKGKWLNDDGKLNEFEWVKAAFLIYDQIFEWLKKTFGEYELIGSEIKLMEQIEDIDFEFYFKGFVDLVIKDSDGIYHIIDFKTTNYGWNKYKKSDTEKQYQITLYKKFVCDKLGISHKKAKTHFVLLKRSPPVKTQEVCELLTISSTPKKTKDATEWVRKSLKLMREDFKMKKRGNCKLCQFRQTEKCP